MYKSGPHAVVKGKILCSGDTAGSYSGPAFAQEITCAACKAKVRNA